MQSVVVELFKMKTFIYYDIFNLMVFQSHHLVIKLICNEQVNAV